jgi:hypothetical protein
MALFNFRFKPLRDVHPWGTPDKPTLHWYGLSDGEQWIEVGHDRLFEISDEFLTEFGGMRCMDYYLARLYEDTLNILPHVLEPVPDGLSDYLYDTQYSDWDSKRDLFFGASAEEMSAEEEFVIDHTMWISERSLFCPHFSAPPKIRMWSTNDGQTHIAWETAHCVCEGVRMWSANSGTYSLETTQFEREIDSFHERLMAAMDGRIADVKRGVLDPSIAIDVAELERAQREHRALFPRLARKLTPPTDWDAARKAIDIVARRGSH